MFKIRTIEKDVADLPANFAVVEAGSYEDGLLAISKAMEDERVNVVVWDNAGDLLPEKLRNELPTLLENAGYYSEYSPGYFRSSQNSSLSAATIHPDIKHTFNSAARSNLAFPSLENEIAWTWMERTISFCKAFADIYEFSRMRYAMEGKQSRKLLNTPHSTGVIHRDELFPEQIRAIVASNLPATLYADEKDKGRHLDNGFWSLREGTDTLWMPRQWAIAVFGAGKTGPLHVNPNPNYYPPPSRYRAIEIIDLTGKKPFIG